MHTWQLQEATSRFSELVDRAFAEGPQLVTRGAEAVVVISATEYRRLLAGPSLLAVLNGAPRGEALDFPVPLSRYEFAICKVSARLPAARGLHQRRLFIRQSIDRGRGDSLSGC